MCPRKKVRLISGSAPRVLFRADLVNTRPLITSWIDLGMPSSRLVPREMPSNRGVSPLEYDLLEFLVGGIAVPVVLPALMLWSLAEAVEEQVRCEADIEAMLKDELLENEMHCESGEITEEACGKRKAELTERLKELEK